MINMSRRKGRRGRTGEEVQRGGGEGGGEHCHQHFRKGGVKVVCMSLWVCVHVCNGTDECVWIWGYD